MDTKELLQKFSIDGDILEVSAFGNGHINKTYKVTTSKGKHYLFQCVNGYLCYLCTQFVILKQKQTNSISKMEIYIIEFINIWKTLLVMKN